MTLAFEDANSKLLDIDNVADAQEPVDLILNLKFWSRYISKLRLGQDFGAEFRSTFDGGVLILKLKFGGDSEAELRDAANIKP